MSIEITPEVRLYLYLLDHHEDDNIRMLAYSVGAGLATIAGTATAVERVMLARWLLKGTIYEGGAGAAQALRKRKGAFAGR